MAFNNYSLMQVGLTVFIFAAVIGVLFQAKYFDGQTRMVPPKQYALLKGFTRFLIMLVFALPWGIYGILMSEGVFGNNIWLNMLICFTVPAFMLSFSLTFLLDTVCFKLNLYDEAPMTHKKTHDFDSKQ